MFGGFLSLGEANEVCHVAGATQHWYSLFPPIYPFPPATSSQNRMVSMHTRTKPRSFSESVGLEREEAGHGHPTHSPALYNVLRVLFPG